MDIEGGASLDDYELLEHLGSGGMGEVHRARQKSLHREVALKRLHAGLAADPTARQRFQREITALARLRTPGVVGIHAVGEDGGRPWFAMELLPGLDLATLRATLASTSKSRGTVNAATARRAVVEHGRTFSTTRGSGQQQSDSPASTRPLFTGSYDRFCAHVLLRCARTLALVHEQGFLHRDLKPANLLLDATGRITLVDFGLVHRADAQSLTRSDVRIGSLPYLPPEILRGQRIESPSRDIYGLGITLHELLTLRPPFGDTPGDLTERITSGRTEPIRRQGDRIASDLAAICRTALDPDPRRRYPSATAMADDLQRFLDHRNIHARPAGPLLRTQRWARRHPTLTTLSIAVFLLLVVGPSAYAIRQFRHASRLHDEWVRSDLARTSYVGSLDDALSVVASVARRTLDDQRIVGSGHLDPVREKALHEMTQFYESLRRHDPEEPRIARRLVESQSRLADLHRQLGDLDSALAAAERAVSLAHAIHEQHDSERPEDTRAVLASCLHTRATLRADHGDEAGAIHDDGKAAALLEAVGADRPGHPAEPVWLESETALANHLASAGRPREALAALDALLDHLQPRGNDADSPQSLRAALLRSNRATTLVQLGRIDEAIAATGEAIATYEARLGVSFDPGLALDLGLALINRASLHRENGAWRTSIPDLERAEQLLRHTRAAWPHRSGPRQRLASTLNALGSSHANLGHREIADGILGEAVALARAGTSRRDSELLADALMARAHLLAPTGSEAALTTIRQSIAALDALVGPHPSARLQANRASARAVAASVHLARRELDAALEIGSASLEMYESARQLAPDAPLTRLQHGKSMLQVGWVHFLRGDPVSCRGLLERAVDECGLPRPTLLQLAPAFEGVEWFRALAARARTDRDD